MLKNRREKVLAGSLLAIVALSLGQDAVDAVVLGPLETKDAELTDLRQKVGSRKLEFGRIEHAQRELKTLCSQSLPPDPSIATTLYQNWLIETARKSGIQSAQVTPGRPILESGVGHRIVLSLQAATGPAQLGAFLDAFYETPLLHRVTGVSLASGTGLRESRPRMSVTIEALSLLDSEPRTELFPQTDNPDDTQADEAESVSGPSAQKFLTGRNPFQRGYNGPPKRSPPKPVRTRPRPKPVDPLTKITLVASFVTETQTEAWFYDSLAGRQTVVALGQDFKLAGLRGKFVTLGSDSAVFEVGGRRQPLRIGDQLSQFAQ